MDYDFSILISQAQAGDNEAIEQILKRNKYLINYVIKKFKLAYRNSIEDYYQIGNIGLINALRTFDINRGVKFSTYGRNLVEKEIINFLRINKKTYSEVYNCLDDIASTYNENDLIELIDLKNAMSKLKPKFRNIIELLFFKDLSQTKIASKLNINQRFVSQYKNAALKQLKKHLTA